jgi:hypothetical protein
MKSKLALTSSDLILKILLAFGLIVFAVAMRILPHPSNIAPVAAVAIFAGTILPKRLAYSLPLLIMMASDFMIGLHPLIAFTWGSFLVIAILSSVYLRKISAPNLVLASLGASSLFFVVTNFGVWLEGKLYHHTLTGLADCYYNALPFFRNTLIGDLAYTGVIFGLYALVYRIVFNKNGCLSIVPQSS